MPSTSNSTNPSLEQQSTSTQLRQRLFTRRQVIPARSDILYKIERGAVRSLTWGEDGTFTTLGYWGLGDLIGYPLSCVEPYQIECLTDVEVSVVPPQLWHQDVDGLIFRTQQTEKLLNIVHCKPIASRLTKFLSMLGEKFGHEVQEGRLIDLNITHQEIAEVLNTTRVTVTRLLQQFEEEKSITRRKRRIILLNRN
jgi:CRP-like cAMP-binding protein